MSKQNLIPLCIWQGRVKRGEREWSSEKRKANGMYDNNR